MNFSRNQKIAINISFAILLIIFLRAKYNNIRDLTPSPISKRTIQVEPYFLEEPGLRIDFDTPMVTGMACDDKILGYMITLRDTTKGDRTTTYLFAQLYYAGKMDDGNYTWLSDKRNGIRINTRASLFIKKSGIATLTDQHYYTVGIKAINWYPPDNMPPTETFSDPIKYSACTQGENKTCQNWGSDTRRLGQAIMSDSEIKKMIYPK